MHCFSWRFCVEICTILQFYIATSMSCVLVRTTDKNVQQYVQLCIKSKEKVPKCAYGLLKMPTRSYRTMYV